MADAHVFLGQVFKKKKERETNERTHFLDNLLVK